MGRRTGNNTHSASGREKDPAMRSIACIAFGVGTVTSTVSAGFLGFVASTRTSGTSTIVDVFCAVSNQSDRFLNVYNANIVTTIAGGFYQQDTANTRGWRPDTVGGTDTRASIDSFMTAGAYRNLPAPPVYAGVTTTGDPNFTSGAWNGTSVLASQSVPTDAGWYTNDPFNSNNQAESLAGLAQRTDSAATPGIGSTGPTVGSAGAQWGIWCAHLVFAGTAPVVFGANGNLFFYAAASIKDGVNGATTQGYSVIPAPGAGVLLAAACGRSRRRRS
jgi:hypothetical protein